MSKDCLIGKKIGKLYVIEKTNKKSSNNGEYKYKCKCECGNEILIRGSNLKTGNSKSCGCSKSKINRKYTNNDKRLYTIYENMKQRCYNKKATGYKNYGGRGIKICDEWLHNYNSFYEWSIKNGYSDDLSIDRINVNGDYSSYNCKWSTKKEQQSNRRTNRFITYKNETKTLAEWSRLLNINVMTLSYRLKTKRIEEIIEMQKH